ncbi:hypothetical protein ABFS83_06G186300 [Erythranthe nasuta]
MVSRSGEECVVALTEQWFITYGEEEWKKAAEECLAGMKLYPEELRNRFETTLSWLNQWGCSRNFLGLESGSCGRRNSWLSLCPILPFTWRTVAHILQQKEDDIYGRVDENSLIRPEELTDEVWDWFLVLTRHLRIVGPHGRTQIVCLPMKST